VLERGIALAFVTPDVEPGDRLVIDVRGREVPAAVVDLPFIPR
jgi:glycine cleavage system aminomethyltransferase T